ncbi:Na(+)/H(+) antiporter subunit G [Myxococcaceae bacterium]|nr:Na(+)/H(+) antiporter subunit G [Myxococcaceae bacterium]
MKEVAVSVLLFAGLAFIVVAAIGIVRLPDFYMRLHANSKSATLGVIFVFLGVALHFERTESTMQALLVIVFFVITAPVASHRIGRAAWRTGVAFHPSTVDRSGIPASRSDPRDGA